MPDIPQLKIIGLGTSGSGKTTFLLGMYAELSAGGPHGYFLNAPDPDLDLTLSSRWDHLLDDGVLPPRTSAEGIPYGFTFLDGIRPLVSVDWYDYRGGALNDAVSAESGDVAELHKRLIAADSVYLVIDGSYLDQPVTPDRVRGTVAATGLRRMTALLQSAIATRSAADQQPPTLILLITKCDLIPRDRLEDLKSLADELRELVPIAFIEGVTALVCPVSLGNFGYDAGTQVSADQIDPQRMHLPIIFSLAEYMRQLSRVAADAVSQTAIQRSELESQLQALRQGVWRSRKAIGLTAKQLRELDQDAAAYAGIGTAAADRAAMLFAELGDLLIYRDGEVAVDV